MGIVGLALFLLSASCVASVRLRAAESVHTSDLKPNTFDRADKRGDRTPPTFPEQYTVSYTFTLPYTGTFLPQPVSYPVRLWVDRKKKLTRIDTYNGLDTELDLGDHVFMITPRVDRWVCRIDGDLPHANLTADNAAPTFRLSEGGLPSLEDWEYAGDVTYQGRTASKWTHVHRDELKISQYYFIVTEEGEPLYLHMLGSELVTGAHFDEYEANFTYFEPFLSKKDAFEVPELCKGRDAEVVEPGALRPMSIHFASLIPHVHQSRSEYDAFAELHNRSHTGATDRHMRATLYQHHAAIIKQHNMKANATFKMGINKFADWTVEEYKMLLGYRSTQAAEAAGTLKQSARNYSATLNDGIRRKFVPTPGWVPLPSQVDWRDSGAVGAVKDQAVCGSCWTFSASQAMSAAWWLATGEFVSLSEQQVMDCSWDYGTNEACDGGDPDMAMQYIVEHGGAYAEEDWPYLGEDDFCKVGKKDSYFGPKPKAFFKEIVRIQAHDEQAVREALYRFGPLSIGIDASPVDFRFYTSGVLWSETCKNNHLSLDHAVLVVGYGEEAGQPYWLVKNEWSAHWGDKGYIKINRHKDCGVATDVTFPVADPAKVAEVMAAKQASA